MHARYARSLPTADFGDGPLPAHGIRLIVVGYAGAAVLAALVCWQIGSMLVAGVTGLTAAPILVAALAVLYPPDGIFSRRLPDETA